LGETNQKYREEKDEKETKVTSGADHKCSYHVACCME
jgi:hypothetical protein